MVGPPPATRAIARESACHPHAHRDWPAASEKESGGPSAPLRSYEPEVVAAAPEVCVDPPAVVARGPVVGDLLLGGRPLGPGHGGPAEPVPLLEIQVEVRP